MERRNSVARSQSSTCSRCVLPVYWFNQAETVDIRRAQEHSCGLALRFRSAVTKPQIAEHSYASTHSSAYGYIYLGFSINKTMHALY